MLRLLLTYGTAIILLLAPLPAEIASWSTPDAFADEMSYGGTYQGGGPSGEAVICDVVFARPLGIVTMVIGAAFFVVSLPWGVASGSTGSAENALIKGPFDYTFTRPLGVFDSDLPEPLPDGASTGDGK